MATIKENIEKKFFNPQLPKITDEEITYRKITYDNDFLRWAALYPDRLVNPDKVTDYLFGKLYVDNRTYDLFSEMLTEFPLPFLERYIPKIARALPVVYDINNMEQGNVRIAFTGEAIGAINILIARAHDEGLNFFFNSPYFIASEIGKSISIHCLDLRYGRAIGRYGLYATRADNDKALQFMQRMENEGINLNLNTLKYPSRYGHSCPLTDALEAGCLQVVSYLLSEKSTYLVDREHVRNVFCDILAKDIPSELRVFIKETKETWLKSLTT